MKRWISLIAVVFCVSVFTIAGCASWKNDIAARGGLVGSHEGDYVVISQSGGDIMDCWVLEDVFVSSEENSDGWRFQDEDGNVIFIGGDTKVIRCKNKSELASYHEYHMEFESQTYREKFGGVLAGK